MIFTRGQGNLVQKNLEIQFCTILLKKYECNRKKAQPVHKMAW